jgi:hypothetical protein
MILCVRARLTARVPTTTITPARLVTVENRIVHVVPDRSFS